MVINFDPPRWSPDVVAAARSHNIAMPPNHDDIEIDTSAPSSNMAETLNIKVVDGERKTTEEAVAVKSNKKKRSKRLSVVETLGMNDFVDDDFLNGFG